MILKINKKGQSMLEYALLLGVVIAAILIMQVFVKRGFQGGLKDSADKMGEQFSAGGTTTQQIRTMNTDQTITEESATTKTTGIGLLPGMNLTGTVDDSKGIYVLNQRTGGKTTSTTRQKTDAAKNEQFRWNEYSTSNVGDYTINSD